MLKLGFYDGDKLALFYDPGKIPLHQIDNLATACVVKAGTSLLVIAKPGMYAASQTAEAKPNDPTTLSRSGSSTMLIPV